MYKFVYALLSFDTLPFSWILLMLSSLLILNFLEMYLLFNSKCLSVSLFHTFCEKLHFIDYF